MNQAQTIALYRPLLQSIAYNLLRCKADAEDIVQDTLLKWLSIDTTKIKNTKAYLIKSVTNNCFNHLEALRRKKEEYWDNVKFSEFIAKWKDSDITHFDFEKELSGALKIIHAKLEPLERVAFLMKDVFDFDYKAMQSVLDKKADNCRQLISRARKKLAEESPRLKIELPNASHLFENFKKACDIGNTAELIQHLKKEMGFK